MSGFVINITFENEKQYAIIHYCHVFHSNVKNRRVMKHLHWKNRPRKTQLTVVSESIVCLVKRDERELFVKITMSTPFNINNYYYKKTISLTTYDVHNSVCFISRSTNTIHASLISIYCEWQKPSNNSTITKTKCQDWKVPWPNVFVIIEHVDNSCYMNLYTILTFRHCSMNDKRNVDS